MMFKLKIMHNLASLITIAYIATIGMDKRVSKVLTKKYRKNSQLHKWSKNLLLTIRYTVPNQTKTNENYSPNFAWSQ